MTYFTHDEIMLLLQLAAPAQRAVILLAYHHGLRISEVLALTPADISCGKLRCHRGKQSLETVEDLIPSPDPLMDEPDTIKNAIRALQSGDLTSSDPTLRPLFGFTRQAFDRYFKRLCLRAGIHRDKAHAHSLKHSCAMHLLHGGATLDIVQLALGHKSLASTSWYLKADDAAVNAAKLKVFGGK